MDLKYKSIKDVLLSLLLGFFIGLSIIVPGISGSTIAIIMKIYDKLMYAFSNIFKKFKSCFIFLIPIGIGIVIGFGIGFILVKLLLEKFPFPTICLFVGLMAGTYPIVHKEIKGETKDIKRISLFISGFILPILIAVISIFTSGNRGLDNLQIYNYIIFLLIGILIALTQLVPGLSATALLMMFGYYTTIMESVSLDVLTNFDILMVYIMLVLGFVIGILLFSKIIDKALTNYKKQFFFIICGLSLGSIISIFLGHDCLEIYEVWKNGNMLESLIPGIILLITGFAATLAFSLYQIKKNIE